MLAPEILDKSVRAETVTQHLMKVMLGAELSERMRAALNVERIKNTDAEGRPPVTMSAARLKEWLLFMCEARDVSEVKQESRRVLLDGLVAGFVLLEVLRLEAVGAPHVSIRAAVQNVGAYKVLREKRRSETAINGIWRQYRSVAHLWAAYLFIVRLRGWAQKEFPPEPIDHFLSLAEVIRTAGEDLIPGHGKGQPVLPPDETWRIPEWFGFKFQPSVFQNGSGLNSSN